MLAIPPLGASSNKALWRANIKPPFEMVVGDLKEDCEYDQMTLKEYYDPFTGEPVTKSTKK